MIISRPDFPAPILVLDEFLPPADAATCLQECIDLRPVYMPGGVGQGAENRIDTKVRRNDVVHLDSVFAAAPERSRILTLVKRRVADPECNRLWHAGYTILDVVNYATHRESVLSRYGRCDFYGLHQDTKRNKERPGEITHRLVTLVYYLNREPEAFTGGQLTLQQDDGVITIAPRHNRAVVFPSFVFHKVESVQLSSDADFGSGRFSLNHWIGFRG